MARPRTFDPDLVLDTARDIFWRKGYQGTSLDDITDETGLSKTSLYAAFGDKASLFLKILEQYHELLLSHSDRMLADGASGRSAIEAWFISIPKCFPNVPVWGCFSVNTATDGGIENVEIRQSVKHFNDRLGRLIVARLRADRDQFSDEFDPLAAGRVIMAIYLGLMVLARLGLTGRQFREATAQIGKLLA